MDSSGGGVHDGPATPRSGEPDQVRAFHPERPQWGVLAPLEGPFGHDEGDVIPGAVLLVVHSGLIWSPRWLCSSTPRRTHWKRRGPVSSRREGLLGLPLHGWNGTQT